MKIKTLTMHLETVSIARQVSRLSTTSYGQIFVSFALKKKQKKLSALGAFAPWCIIRGCAPPPLCGSALRSPCRARIRPPLCLLYGFAYMNFKTYKAVIYCFCSNSAGFGHIAWTLPSWYTRTTESKHKTVRSSMTIYSRLRPSRWATWSRASLKAFSWIHTESTYVYKCTCMLNSSQQLNDYCMLNCY